MTAAVKKLSDFLRAAHLHGLSDAELTTLDRLVRSADEWQQYMRHVGDANNFNGTLSRAVDEAREVFGFADGPDDPHMHCHWKCVAVSPRHGPQVKRCAKDQPTVNCKCGIENAVAWGACVSCKNPLPTTVRK